MLSAATSSDSREIYFRVLFFALKNKKDGGGGAGSNNKMEPWCSLYQLTFKTHYGVSPLNVTLNRVTYC